MAGSGGWGMEPKFFKAACSSFRTMSCIMRTVTVPAGVGVAAVADVAVVAPFFSRRPFLGPESLIPGSRVLGFGGLRVQFGLDSC